MPQDRKITGFHKDPGGEWVAELECGHTQHVRHDPPWTMKPWVVTAEGRESRIGHALSCIHCEEGSERRGVIRA